MTTGSSVRTPPRSSPGYLVSLSIGDLVLAADVALFFLTAMRSTDRAAAAG